MVNRCWDLFFIKLNWKSKPNFDLTLSLDLISLQIKWFNPKDRLKLYIQFILSHFLIIHTMQLFNFIKFSFKNLMNLPNLHCNSYLI